MSRKVTTTKRIVKTTETISNKLDLSSKFKTDTISSNNATLETNVRSDLNYTLSNRSKKIIFKKINLNQNMNRCTCSDKKQIMTTASENLNTLNSINTTTSNDSQITEIEEKNLKYEYENIFWSGDLYMQKEERLQYLPEEPPKLFVQFPDNMMIHRTISLEPIRLLIPIPENYVQSQDHFEILTNNENKQVQDLPKEISSNKNQSLTQEKHSLEINPNQKTWNGPIQPVKTNKMIYDEIAKKNWNELLQKEFQLNINYEGVKKEKKEVKKIKVEKAVYILSKEISFKVGGTGFKPRVWALSKINVINLTFSSDHVLNSSSSEQSIIINDDYNNTDEIKLRSITVTIIKMRDDEEETESTDDYDIFENINVTKIDLTNEISNAWTNMSQKNIVIKEKEKMNQIKKGNKNEFYEINFISEDKTFNGKKIFKKGISVIENEQKNQFDQNVQ